jgi:tyrosyl-tRNA synthetase
MDFIEELRWRNLIHDMTPGIEELLQQGPCLGYIGFDPTAPSLTIGNYVQIMLLKLFQLSGHQPIVLMGGATGRVGDPSGKDKERDLISYDELDANLEKQAHQMRTLIDFDGVPNPAILVNNLDFYREMNVLDFLRNVGKNLTINYMMSKESVRKRVEYGLSFTEFSYQLLQAYDFLCLYEQHNCRIQMGGSDQWGNITSGTEFIRRNIPDGKAYALTTPLLTKADGSKFGKSEEGNIWLDPDYTSPYKFYQFWINSDDRDLRRLYEFFSLKPQMEIQSLIKAIQDDPLTVKRELAAELTIRIHSQEAYDAVLNVSGLLFNRKMTGEALRSMKAGDLEMVCKEIPSYHISRDLLEGGVLLTELLTDMTEAIPSRSEVRRSIRSQALAVNKQKVADETRSLSKSDLLHDRFVLIENGKKNKLMIEVA